MAGATVTTTIRVVGEDRASKPIREVRAELDATAKAAAHAGEKAGDMEQGFRGIKDILGNVGGEALQGITDKFGGIEALIKGFGPALGPFAVGIAAIGAGVAYWYEQQEKIRVAAHQAKIEAIAVAALDLEAHAKSLNVSAMLLGFKNEERSVDAAITAGKETAAEIDAIKVKIEEALIANEKDKIVKLEHQLDLKQNLIHQDQIQLETAIRHAKVRDAATAMLIEGKTKEIEKEAEIKAIRDDTQRLDAKFLHAEQQLTLAVAAEKTARDAVTKAVGYHIGLETTLNTAVSKRVSLEETYRQLQAEEAAAIAAKAAKAKAAHDAAMARRKTIRDANAAFAADETRDLEAQFQARKDIANREFLAAQEQAKAEKADNDALRVSAQAVTDDPAEKARLQLMEIDEQQRERLDAVKQRHFTNDNARDTARLAIEQELNGKRKVILDGEMAREKAKAAQEIDMQFSVARAAVAGLEQIGIGERAAAGLKAVLAAAEGALAYTRGRYDQALAGAFAAIQFGSIALSSAPSSPASGAGGGGFAGQTAQIGATPTESGGGAVNINFSKGFVVGTSQDVGKAVSKAVKSLGSTGYAQKQAA